MGLELPKLNPIKTATDGVVSFAGLNRKYRRNKNEFPVMRNMQSLHLPVASVRERRHFLRELESPHGLFAHDKLMWVDDTNLYDDGEIVGQVEDSDKRFVRMGAQVIIFPDKLLYNHMTRALESLDATFVSTGTVSCALCRYDGNPYGAYTISDTAPESPVSGQVWMDTSGETDVLRQYDANNAVWAGVPTVYTAISCTGIGANFAKNDGVVISGMENTALNGEFYIVSRTNDQIVVTALIQQASAQTAAATIKRPVPDMDFVCECDNRLWGCSSDAHEIYASALGDPKNWRQYLGLATDSYTVTVGSGGNFTGAVSHLGNVYFFKADCIHQMMGNKPANFTLTTLQARGVGAGNEKTLCRVNETLYYLGNGEAYSFGSSIPYPISDAIPQMGGHGVGGMAGSRYFLCVDGAEGSRELLCFDMTAKVWVREDEADVQDFATLNGKLYFLKTNGELWRMGPGEDAYDGDCAADEAPVEWLLETSDMGLDEAYSKYISRIQLHAEVDLGATLKVAVQYDNSGEWQDMYSSAPMKRKSLVVPLIPKRCRSLRLRLHGTGGMRLYSIVRKTEAGSDIYAM